MYDDELKVFRSVYFFLSQTNAACIHVCVIRTYLCAYEQCVLLASEGRESSRSGAWCEGRESSRSGAWCEGRGSLAGVEPGVKAEGV